MIQDSGPNFRNLNYSDSFRNQLNMRKLENIFDLCILCIKYLDRIGWIQTDRCFTPELSLDLLEFDMYQNFFYLSDFLSIVLKYSYQFELRKLFFCVYRGFKFGITTIIIGSFKLSDFSFIDCV